AHAAGWSNCRQPRFQQSLRSALGKSHAWFAAGRSKEIGSGLRVWQFHQHHDQFSDRRVLYFSRRQRDQQTETAKEGSAAGEGLPGVHDVDPGQGNALSALHDGTVRTGTLLAAKLATNAVTRRTAGVDCL